MSAFNCRAIFGGAAVVWRRRVAEGAHIRRERASKARLKAHLSPRPSATVIVHASTARHGGTGRGRSSPINRRISANSNLATFVRNAWPSAVIEARAKRTPKSCDEAGKTGRQTIKHGRSFYALARDCTPCSLASLCPARRSGQSRTRGQRH